MKGPKDPTPVYVPRTGYFPPGRDRAMQIIPDSAGDNLDRFDAMDIAIGHFRGEDNFTHGTRLPSMKKGGVVPRTGAYKLHKGERVIPAPTKKPARRK